MSGEFNLTKDMLANVTADLDQVQASIDEGRSKFKNDLIFQLALDNSQKQLNEKREQVIFLKNLVAVIES